MRILVTGGLGFIGSNFVRMLLLGELDDLVDVNVTVLDKLTYAGNLQYLSSFNSDERLRVVIGDVTSEQDVASACKDVDYVVHFAAETHVDRSIIDSTPFVQTNIIGTAIIARICREMNIKLLLISTDEVYGSIPIDFANENSQLLPSSAYSASKAAADLLALAEFHTHKADIRITRCTNNFGLNQFPEKLIPVIITRASQNIQIPIYGNGKQERDWVFVEDHCRAIRDVMIYGRAGDVYNVGFGNPLQNITIVKAILDYMDKDQSLIQYVGDRLGHDYRYAVDTKKISSLNGWKPSISILDAIPRLVKYYS